MKSFQAIRAKFPFDYERECNSLRGKLLVAGRAHKRYLRRGVDLGEAHDVTAVRYAPRGAAILIQTSKHNVLFPITLAWAPDVRPPKDLDSFGFGEIVEENVVAVGVALPTLYLVEKVMMKREEYDNFAVQRLRVETGNAHFQFNLFCEI